MNGFILVDKPIGISSFGALKELNHRFLIQRKYGKIGHGGTLDPYASGLLVIAVGKATRLLRFFLGSDKRYIADIKFGERSSSDDREGEIIATAPVDHLSNQALREALDKFHGEISQIPPAFSAVHVDGKRAYLLARSGEMPDIPPKNVVIHRTDIISANLPAQPVVQLDILCSGGTYIRSIARDLGWELKSEAYLAALRRTQACHFDISQAVSLETLLQADDIEPFIHSPLEAMKKFHVIERKNDDIIRLLRGLPVNFNIAKDGIYTILGNQQLVAVLERKNAHNEFVRFMSEQDFKSSL